MRSASVRCDAFSPFCRSPRRRAAIQSASLFQFPASESELVVARVGSMSEQSPVSGHAVLSERSLQAWRGVAGGSYHTGAFFSVITPLRHSPVLPTPLPHGLPATLFSSSASPTRRTTLRQLDDLRTDRRDTTRGPTPDMGAQMSIDTWSRQRARGEGWGQRIHRRL